MQVCRYCVLHNTDGSVKQKFGTFPVITVYDREGSCFIPPELFCIDGKGVLYTRDSVDDPFIVETIDVVVTIDTAD